MNLRQNPLLSNFKSLLVALTVAAAVSRGAAHAAYTKVDDFESYTSGSNIGGQGNWHSVGTAANSQVVADPANAANKCLRVNATWSGCYNTLASAVPASSTATIFFRGNFPGQYAGNAIVGLSKNNPPSGMSSGDGDLSVGLEYNGYASPYVGAYNGSSLTQLFNSNATWFKYWLVVNTTANTYAIYTNTAGPAVASGYAFRNGGTGTALPSFLLGGEGSNGGGNNYVDDIYIDYSGDSHTTDPTTPAAPPAPSGLTIAGCNSMAVLSWSLATGATGYNVERSTSSGGEANLGSTASTVYTDTTVTVGNTYYYVVAATNTVGVSSNSVEVSATISANSAPVVSQQPTNIAVCAGVTASFTSVAGGSPSVQWQVSVDNGTNWNNVSTGSGGTTTTYTTAATMAGDNGKQYRAQFSSACGNINSTAATLTVGTSVGITMSPGNLTVCSGQAATFTVTSTGTAVAYQWQVSTDSGTTWNNVSGATSATYSFSAAIGDNGKQYRAVVGNICGSLNSSSATLTVDATCTGPNIIPWLDANNVNWNVPGPGSSQSMPLGNGDIGLNVWVEANGAVDFYIGKTDAWGDDVAGDQGLMKVGGVRVTLSPNPLTLEAPFSQILLLHQGEIQITEGSGVNSVVLRIWVDANNPVIHVEATSGGTPVTVQVSLNDWRLSASNPDVVLAGQTNSIGWYHRNSSTDDPHVANWTFGAMIQGAGLVNTSPTNLTSTPVTYQLISIYPLTTRTQTASQWLAQLQANVSQMAGRNLEATRTAHQAWWDAFWHRSWVFVTGDKDATNVTQGYVLQRFITACAGRGAYPIKFNGSLFVVDNPAVPYTADGRRWGGQYWFQNTRLMYWPLLASGDFEMMQPLFNMYAAQIPSNAVQVAGYYGHQGAYLAETAPFWGGLSYEGPDAPAWFTGHYFEPILELSMMMLDYYDFTGDTNFVANTLLPVTSAGLDFYDQHFSRDGSGKILLDPVNALETYWKTHDPAPDIAGLSAVLPRMLTLPTNLVSVARRNQWTRMLSEVPPLPVGTYGGDSVLLPYTGPQTNQIENGENAQLYAIFPYRIYGLNKPNLPLAISSFNTRLFYGLGWADWMQDPIQAAMIGLTNVAQQYTVYNMTNTDPSLKFPAFWAAQNDYMPAQDWGGVAEDALQKMIMQTDGTKIILLPAWPSGWNANFQLHAPYQTTVQGTIQNGQVINLVVTPPERLADVIGVTLQAPIASFSANPTSGATPLGVTFTDNSTGAITNWFWNFGDGNTLNTTSTSVPHTYTAAGTYTVTEVVSGPSGVSTNAQANYIVVAPALPPSLRAWLTFNNTLIDATGNGHNGAFVGNATYSSSVPNATAGTASLQLPDGGSSVTVTNSSDLNMNTGQPFTLACWFSGVTNSASWPTVIMKQPASGWDCATNNRGGLMISPSGHLRYDVSCTGAAESSASVTNGLWHHGVVVYSGTNYQLYVDGSADGTGTFAGCNEGAHGEAAWTFNVGYGFVGNIDEVAFWNVALTASQIHQIYTNGVGVLSLPAFQQWQMQYFGCTNCAQADPSADPLGKGMNNQNQFLAGLDPTNPASLFRILSVTPQTGNVNVTWQTGGGKTNAVQVVTGAYNANFVDLSGLIVITGSGDTTTNFVDGSGATNGPSRFYRVRLVP